ncbi:3-oxoacyl-ACP synthase [Chromobacterium sp. LK11]|uniref:beta-ketoacyl-[acyl-carrier-protein] synthase family protein n=1 Tax=Chromobacterium sp. LK11 TaxID=1628212 RepID=UPI000654772E|nr:beta-ketoacyl-[acyl-carrier-protein] synthase family protein [Chromobacterium sp. LK11]KMN83469.1 3-oxoacyl-ACP synthase [Chromobacterium sp. LK11]
MTVYLNELAMINALGRELPEIHRRLLAGDCGGMCEEAGAVVGRVAGALPEIPAELARYDSRNNRLLLAALEPLRVRVEALAARYGRHRIGVVLGTSTSGILETELAVAAAAAGQALPEGYDYVQQEMGSPALFLAELLGLDGVAYVVSTACSSSAKAVAAAARLLSQGLCDAVICGGADSLCQLTQRGFAALESVSPDLCQPMSARRRGINIGEGAALFIASREPGPVALLGYGESSDAWHMSSPHPEGRGAEAAMRQALSMAGAEAAQVGYVNLHGTATVKNDEMESLAMTRVFPDGVPASSTKPLVGHLLGAAGATELGFCWLVLSDRRRRLPPHVWDGAADPALPALSLTPAGAMLPAGRPLVMSNSYAFGGNNVSLLLAATAADENEHA